MCGSGAGLSAGVIHRSAGRQQLFIARSGSFTNGVRIMLVALPLLGEPLMKEVVRYAWESSSLGELLAAVTSKGLVAVELGSDRSFMLNALRARLPQADLIESPSELRDVLNEIVRAIEDPARHSQFHVPLDLRGTPYEIQVWSMLRSIPGGETTSYGSLAAKMGTRDAREITKAIAANPIAVLVPCHRVIKTDGSISGYRWGVARKRELLAREQRGRPFRLS
jgi:AraC family transcriptional regulator of adaptative response/methylated-DNA-[protein]-cysteine methyltransferase